MKSRNWHCKEIAEKTFGLLEAFNDGRIRLNERGEKRNKTSGQGKH